MSYNFRYIVHCSKPNSIAFGRGRSRPEVWMTLEASTVAAHTPLFLSRIWAPAILMAGFGLTLAWTAFLGYELIELVGMAL
jgi:hypothetical protein